MPGARTGGRRRAVDHVLGAVAGRPRPLAAEARVDVGVHLVEHAAEGGVDLGDAGRVGEVGVAAEAHRLQHVLAGRRVVRRVQRRPHHAAAEAGVGTDEQAGPAGEVVRLAAGAQDRQAVEGEGGGDDAADHAAGARVGDELGAERRRRQQREELPDGRIADHRPGVDRLAEPALRRPRLDADRAATVEQDALDLPAAGDRHPGRHAGVAQRQRQRPHAADGVVAGALRARHRRPARPPAQGDALRHRRRLGIDAAEQHDVAAEGLGDRRVSW